MPRVKRHFPQSDQILIWLRGLELSVEDLEVLARSSAAARAAWEQQLSLMDRAWRHQLEEQSELHADMWEAWLEDVPTEDGSRGLMAQDCSSAFFLLAA